MGFWDFVQTALLSRGGQTAPASADGLDYSIWGPRVTHVGAAEWDDWVSSRSASEWARQLSVTDMWKAQPHIRTVVTFLARNVAQLGLHVFERDGDNRRRDRTSPIAQALAAPGDRRTTYDLMFALVGDKALYDRAYLLPWYDTDGSWRLRRLPPAWVSVTKVDPFAPVELTVTIKGTTVRLDPSKVIALGGYSPTSPTGCSPTIDTLRETIAEQLESSRYRAQVWRRGGRASSVIQRPPGVQWSAQARDKFREDWNAKFTGDGSLAGGTPILEDGMTLNRFDFSASDQQYVESVKLSFGTVASAFHVNPTMVGLLDNANYSNVREFRRGLYGDTLGPLLAEIESAFNTFALPLLKMDPARFYVEFNIAEKLQGNFEEQAVSLQSSVGRPWMTADEARARMNMPALGGDAEQLVTPLNVLVGGQSSPRDSGSQNLRAAGKPRVKAAPEAGWVKQHERVLKRAFARQAAAVRTARGLKAAGDWWDGERWDRELAADLTRVGLATATAAGRAMLDSHAWDPDAYDEDRTVNWVRAVSKGAAGRINAATRDALQDGFDDDEADDSDIIDAELEDGADWRIGMLAVSSVTTMAGFGRTEAGRQTSAGFKVWIVNSGNPRPEHAALDGERVPIDEPFSNGMDWPGDPAGDVDDLAGCTCTVEVSWEAS